MKAANVEEAARRIFEPARGERATDKDRQMLVLRVLKVVSSIKFPGQDSRIKYRDMVKADMYRHGGGDMANDLLVAFMVRYQNRGERNIIKVCMQAADDCRPGAQELSDEYLTRFSAAYDEAYGDHNRTDRDEGELSLDEDTVAVDDDPDLGLEEASLEGKRHRDFDGKKLTIEEVVGECDYEEVERIEPSTPLEKDCAKFIAEVQAGRQGGKQSYRLRQRLKEYGEYEVSQVIRQLDIPDYIDVKIPKK